MEVGSGVDVTSSLGDVTGTSSAGADASTPDAGVVADGKTECVPNCEGVPCGDDGCGGVCDACDDGIDCTADVLKLLMAYLGATG